MGFWDHIKRSFNEGRDKANREFEEQHGYPPDQEIARGWERGKQAARDGRSLRDAMGQDDKRTDDKGKE